MTLHLLAAWLGPAAMFLVPAGEPARAAAETELRVHVSGYERLSARREADEILAGRLLINELNCAACHSGLPDGPPAPKQAPALAGITRRMHGKWLRAFLLDPRHVQAGATMPAMFDQVPAAEAAVQVDDILHYLATTTTPRPPAKLPRRSTFARGKLLYHRYGCVACHEPGVSERGRGDASAKVSKDRRRVAVPLPDAQAKYSHQSLTGFLLNPLATRPSGRMPGMKLDLQDASDIAAYLVRRTGNMDNAASPSIPPPGNVDAERARRGRQHLLTLGCTACHRVANVAPSPRTPLSSAGLMAAASERRLCRGRPRYAVSAEQRERVHRLLAEALGSSRDKPRPLSSAQVVDLTLLTFDCYGCHRRQGQGGVPDERRSHFTGDPDLGDEGRYPPPLTDVGRKLSAGWMARVLGGAGDVRPYLHSRMPAYGMPNLDHLPDLLVKVDGGMRHAPAVDFAGGDAEIGRQLMGTAGGLGCIACHGWRDRRSLGIPGLNLATTADRLQPAWFKQNLVDPARLRPGTLMPAFWPRGVATNKKLAGGDTDRQIASIWKYLSEGKEPAPGYPLVGQGEFELVPRDRPIVMRSFTREAGRHTVLVGYPQGTHFMFDTKQGRLAMAWRGRFIDAYSTWFDRFAAPAQALGEDRVVLAPTSLLKPGKGGDGEQAADAAAYRFLGYRLDPAGVPTFLYEMAGARVEDRIIPARPLGDGRPGLARTLNVLAPDGGLLVRAATGPGLSVRLIKPVASRGRDAPIKLDPGKAVIELEYRW